ncbi:FkbM family methyltransferase [Agrobacterium tumefaciens]|uniref:FkbM family methyltransferase n=1 Tax=Agrobacterium tumefaciens TaxID=358 RepID=UPI000F97817F|nr:FkbM family methyltransferase [Agrobacterium tumefaciens]NSX93849.1 FkbM family methyltransferase [Agrobacterium tumefaciens]
MVIRLIKSIRRYSRDLKERLVHIEAKVDAVIRDQEIHNRRDNSHDIKEAFWTGHPDQQFGGLTFSQHGEDLVILSIFYQLGIKNPDYIDIGAHHPVNISNTALLYKLGSRGINIEANPILSEEFIKARPDDINLNIGISDSIGELDFYMIDDRSGRNSFSREVAERFVQDHPQFSITNIRKIPVTTVSTVLEKYYNGKCPAFLSIDVEGLDYTILKSIDFNQYRPIVVCVEVVFAGADEQKDEIFLLMRQAGYYVHFATSGNLIFVDQAMKAKLRPWAE